MRKRSLALILTAAVFILAVTGLTIYRFYSLRASHVPTNRQVIIDSRIILSILNEKAGIWTSRPYRFFTNTDSAIKLAWHVILLNPIVTYTAQ